MPVSRLGAAASALLLVSALAAPAAAEPTETFPLSAVRPGQKGYGLTTFHGTVPERFTFEVIGVTKNFRPKMDLILVKSDDPKMQLAGFWQGMSGSPLFINGKLACAFSYGFRFNKVAIGGCTPIAYMKREGFRTARRIDDEARPRRPETHARAAPKKAQPPRSVASLAEWLAIAPDRRVSTAMSTLAAPRKPWILNAPLPKVAGPSARAGNGMVAAAVPLALSGFTQPAFAKAKALMASYPITPMQAGGTGNPNGGPTEFKLGAPISVQLIRGDMSAAATGTVSFVDTGRVLAFGHPLFQAGELYAPVASAKVHTVIPSRMSSFVLASPMRELGALVQDRQSTIMASTHLVTEMIPIDIKVTSRGDPAESGEFHVQVLNNRFLTGPLAGMSAMNAVSYYLPDRDDATVRIESEVDLAGQKPLHFVDYVYAQEGASSAIGAARGLKVLVPLLLNPFAPVDIQRVKLDIDIHYVANYGDITDLRLPVAKLLPGKKTYVDVVLRRYDGTDVVRRVPFFVPKRLAGSIVKLEVSSGDQAEIDAAPPTDLPELLDVLRKMLPGNVIAVTLSSADEGIAVDGALVHDLPASVLDQIRSGASTQRSSVYRPIARSVAPATRVIEGSQSTLVMVADK
ncbi:MAG TPA: hypothetical protein VFG83_02945 [Kofleriaceae bacterium]|nr:hypothetical protein [Kofleriaceae bacterium]